LISPELLESISMNFNWVELVLVDDLAVYPYRKFIRVICWMGFASLTLRRIKKLKANRANWCDLSFLPNTQIYIFNDSQLLSEVVMHGRRGVILVEEGASNYLEVEDLYSFWVRIIMRALGAHYRLGRSPHIKQVFLSMCQSCPMDLARKTQSIDLNLTCLPEHSVKQILDSFLHSGFSNVPINNSGQILLVVMQRLNLLGLSEEECKDFYQLVVQHLTVPGRRIFLKPHPSDRIDYGDIEGAEFSDGSIPLEVLIELMSGKTRSGLAGYSLIKSSVANVGQSIEWDVAFPEIEILEQLTKSALIDYRETLLSI